MSQGETFSFEWQFFFLGFFWVSAARFENFSGIYFENWMLGNICFVILVVFLNEFVGDFCLVLCNLVHSNITTRFGGEEGVGDLWFCFKNPSKKVQKLKISRHLVFECLRSKFFWFMHTNPYQLWTKSLKSKACQFTILILNDPSKIQF